MKHFGTVQTVTNELLSDLRKVFLKANIILKYVATFFWGKRTHLLYHIVVWLSQSVIMIKWKLADVIQSFEIVRMKKIQTTDSRCFQKSPEVMKFAVCLATYLSTINKFLVILKAKLQQGSSFVYHQRSSWMYETIGSFQLRMNKRNNGETIES